jgi:hypothetical protein
MTARPAAFHNRKVLNRASEYDIYLVYVRYSGHDSARHSRRSLGRPFNSLDQSARGRGAFRRNRPRRLRRGVTLTEYARAALVAALDANDARERAPRRAGGLVTLRRRPRLRGRSVQGIGPPIPW